MLWAFFGYDRWGSKWSVKQELACTVMKFGVKDGVVGGGMGGWRWNGTEGVKGQKVRACGEYDRAVGLWEKNEEGM
ncbi:hypothetical protein L484_016743 [Morus notabilis]|uniref:Uncharacterized protein n=1 Tax=Morus notabilis TaxID=981085 RepID=W9QVJ1_9ROSA|nr:hypothetical protein L484_016743 [Morus notabilis]